MLKFAAEITNYLIRKFSKRTIIAIHFTFLKNLPASENSASKPHKYIQLNFSIIFTKISRKNSKYFSKNFGKIANFSLKLKKISKKAKKFAYTFKFSCSFWGIFWNNLSRYTTLLVRPVSSKYSCGPSDFEIL